MATKKKTEPEPVVEQDETPDPAEGFRDTLHSIIDRTSFHSESQAQGHKAAVDAYLGFGDETAADEDTEDTGYDYTAQDAG
jgi:hypothetical protein